MYHIFLFVYRIYAAYYLINFMSPEVRVFSAAEEDSQGCDSQRVATLEIPDKVNDQTLKISLKLNTIFIAGSVENLESLETHHFQGWI